MEMPRGARGGRGEGARPLARVFVSSVVDGFGQCRAAAREGIAAAGGEPLLVNEDFPSLATSSRNACLDAVDSADVFVLIIGARGGWQAPSGKLVVEEEYERALVRKLPVLVFLQEGSRDAAAERFARRLSDYIDGSFRRTFATPADLRAEMQRALEDLFIGQNARRTMATPRQDPFERPHRVQSTTMLRFVLTPERDEEVIDPVRLASPEFTRRVYEIGHADDVQLLSFERSKEAALEGDDLVVVQNGEGGRQRDGQHVRLQISGAGEVIIDANVTGRRSRGGAFAGLDALVIAVEDIGVVLQQCFAFSAAFYEQLDPFKRHQRFEYNLALSGLDYRMIEHNPQARSSYTMSMRNRDVVRAFDQPRVLARADLHHPEREIERAIELLVRRADA